MIPVFVISVYGGYFGAGMGILILAIISLFGIRNVHRANAVKSFLAFAINGAALIPFVIAGKIWWGYAGVLSIGMITGAYLSARIAQKISPVFIRIFIIALGFFLSALYFVKYYRA